MSEAIKATIRKLMAYANDGAASDGEIENAMAHAARLIDAHHLDASEFQADASEPAIDDAKMGLHYGAGGASRLASWEGTLALAISKLFGCVQCYRDWAQQVQRINGIAQTDAQGNAKQVGRFAFYGPDMEAREASDLFSEWAMSIATMGVIRWGGAYRGDGAAYCDGFASALYAKACAIDSKRIDVAAKPLALPGAPTSSTAITLASRYDTLRDMGRDWLKTAHGIKLGRSSGSSGYRGSSNARAEGRSHGNASTFARRASTKLLGN